ncbi:hypothetical protein NUM3379_19700 [Kineococcus sp. NUM-3379]
MTPPPTRPPWTDGLARRALPRAAGLLGVGLAGRLVADVAASRREAVGADIGSGLALLGVLAVAAGVWGARDGLRAARSGHDLVPGLVCWVTVAVAVGIGFPLVSAALTAVQGGFDVRVLLQDLVLGAPFLVLLVGVPAHGALAGTYAVSRSRAARAAGDAQR